MLWFEPTYKTLQLAPLTVASLLRDNLLKKTPVIATSATLTFGKSFDSIAKSIGFTIGDESDIELKDNEIDPGNLQMLDVGSPLISLIKECFTSHVGCQNHRGKQ